MCTQRAGESFSSGDKAALLAARSKITLLAAAVLLALGTVTRAYGTDFVVSDVGDSGPGTLRQAVLDANASEGPHTISFTVPSGSTIALTSGQIAFTGPDVIVSGPGRDLLTISGNQHSRIFDVEAGSLSLHDLTLRDGLALVDATNLYDQAGGAIRVGPLPAPISPSEFSQALVAAHDAAKTARFIGERPRASRSAALMAIRNVQSLHPRSMAPLALTVDHVAFVDNRAEAPDLAVGGAISAEDGAVLVVHDRFFSGNSANALGGAICALGGTLDTPMIAAGSFDIRNTTFSANHIDMNGTEEGQGAAVLTEGPGGSIRDSVFRDNVINDSPPAQPDLDGIGGGLVLVMSTLSIDIVNTEISDNTVVLRSNVYSEGAGLYCYQFEGTYASLTVTNSTISGNRSQYGAGIEAACNLQLVNTTIAGNIGIGPGHLGFLGDAVELVHVGGQFNAESALIANLDSDVDLVFYQDAPNLGFVSKSLIFAPDPSTPPLPSDTIISIDPLLAQLANNGGATRTQALQTGSVAIDAGANTGSLTFDQRGSGFARVKGASADIGAFEVDSDRILTNGFE